VSVLLVDAEPDAEAEEDRVPPPEPAALPPPKQRAFIQCLRIAMARPWLFSAAMGLYAIFYAAPLLPGLVQRAIFDTLSGRRPAGLNVWSLIALWFAVQVAPLAIVRLANWAWTSFASLSRSMVRANMLAWLLFAQGPRRPHGTAGEALSRFRDDLNEVIAFIEGWVDTLGQGVFAVLALAIMWRIDSQVTLAVILPMAVVVVITQRITAGVHKYSRAAREAEARVTSFVGEIFAAVQAIRVAGAEDRVMARLDELNLARRRTAVRHRIYTTLLETFGVGTSSFALGLILLLAAETMRNGRFTVGDFTLFAAYVGTATSAPRWLGRLLARKRTADVALMRVDLMLGDAPDRAVTAPRPAERTPIGARAPLRRLEVRGLTSLHGPGRGVMDVDFTLEPGQTLIVAGRVGSGKTTLLRAVLGLAPLHGGEILWNGEPVSDPATFLTPPRAAYTPQTPRLFTETLRENILMGEPADEATLNDALRLAVLEEDLARLDDGLETLVGARGVTLSGGQIQRAALARMFVRRPDLLVFDDASSALDVRTEHTFWERLFALEPRPAVLAVSHRLEAYRRADQILLLDQGRVAARGDLRTLLHESALFREVWRETVRAGTHGSGG
jgi:ATP-binding cassette, subfamily B, bacterial